MIQAWTLTLSGHDARAESRIAEAERLIDAQDQTLSRSFGLTIIASIRQTRGEAELARDLATIGWQTASEHRLPC